MGCIILVYGAKNDVITEEKQPPIENLRSFVLKILGVLYLCNVLLR